MAYLKVSLGAGEFGPDPSGELVVCAHRAVACCELGELVMLDVVEAAGEGVDEGEEFVGEGGGEWGRLGRGEGGVGRGHRGPRREGELVESDLK